MAGLTDKGFTTPTYQEIVDQLRTTYEQELAKVGINDSIDWERDRVYGLLTKVVALLLASGWVSLRQVYDSFNVNGASGRSLDNLSEINNVFRDPATYSTTSVTLGGTAGVVVAAGQIVQDISGQSWITLEDATLPATDVPVRALNTGFITAAAGEISIIVTTVSGWTSVTNPTAATPGRRRQNDTELRLSRLAQLQAGTRGSLGGVVAAIRRLDFITDVFVYENDTNGDVFQDPITLPRNSFAPVVFPGTLTSEQVETLALTIRDFKPAGVRSYGLNAEVVPTADGNKTISIGYTAAQAQGLTFEVDARLAPNYTVEGVEGLIETALEEYLATVGVGGGIYQLEICGRLAQVPGLRAVVVRSARTGDPLVTTDYELNAVSYPVLDALTVAAI